MKGAFDLTGKNAIITGGNGGIGLGIAKAFAECGANIAIFCRNMTKADKAIKELNDIGGRHEVFTCDVADIASTRTAVAEAYKSYGDFDVLVNNAGVTNNIKLFDMDDELSEFYYVQNIDLNGIIHCTYEVAKRMRDSGKGGSIINITSNAGLMVNKGMDISQYASSKAAANAFTKYMGYELAEHDIRVNAIAPGFIGSGFGDKPRNPEREAWIGSRQPIHRIGECIEIGAMSVYLASDASTYTTGAIFVVDGGYSLSC
jgi:NAD(P)-dependent dehydrogenase (short-subunit alcohol dehydrogenase family)